MKTKCWKLSFSLTALSVALQNVHLYIPLAPQQQYIAVQRVIQKKTPCYNINRMYILNGKKTLTAQRSWTTNLR